MPPELPTLKTIHIRILWQLCHWIALNTCRKYIVSNKDDLLLHYVQELTFTYLNYNSCESEISVLKENKIPVCINFAF